MIPKVTFRLWAHFPIWFLSLFTEQFSCFSACPSPFFLLGNGTRTSCYYVSDNLYEWLYAQELCAIADSHIVYVKTANEQAYIQEYLTTNEIGI